MTSLWKGFVETVNNDYAPAIIIFVWFVGFIFGITIMGYIR